METGATEKAQRGWLIFGNKRGAGMVQEIGGHTNLRNRHGIPKTPFVGRMGVMSTQNKYSPKVRERAVRLAFEQQGEH